MFYFAVWLWLILAFPIFLLLLKIRAPFGRHTSLKWGAVIENKWGWFVMELPALLVCSGLYFILVDSMGLEGWFVIMWIIHYFYRSCIFPFRLRTKGKSMPWAVVLMGVGFNSVNGFFCGYYFSMLADYPAEYIWQWNFVFGLLLFVGGMLVNWRADNMLINLRKKSGQGYRIPQGFLFRWVSSPNLLGEIVEWSGFALMVWALPTTAFAIWTSANLIPRALAHHQWYLREFPSYPPERKAIIPFIL